MARTIMALVLAALLLVPLVAGVASAQTGPPPNPTPTQIGPSPTWSLGYPVKLDRGVVQRDILTMFSALMFVFLVFAAVTVVRGLGRPRHDVIGGEDAERQRPPARAA